MALTMQLQLNPRAKPFVPTVKANKLLQHRLYRGKWEEGEALVSKHQTQLGRVRWVRRRGEGEPNPSRETLNSGANGGRYWRTQVLSFLFVRRFCLFVFVCSLELCRCSSDIFLSGRPRTGLTTTYITGYG